MRGARRTVDVTCDAEFDVEMMRFYVEGINFIRQGSYSFAKCFVDRDVGEIFGLIGWQNFRYHPRICKTETNHHNLHNYREDYSQNEEKVHIAVIFI